MGIYSKAREVEALSYMNTLIELGAENRGRDPQAIYDYIKEHHKAAIIEFMRDGDEWMKLVLNKLTEFHIEQLDEAEYVAGSRVYRQIVDSILLNSFCEDLNDLVHEIDHYLEQTEGEPTYQQMCDEWNADFEKMR